MKFLVAATFILIISVGVSTCIDMINLMGYNEPDKNHDTLGGTVNFNVQEVLVTNELELYDFWNDENKREFSPDSKFVIISIVIENTVNTWAAVESVFDSLTDNKGDKYSAEMYIEINGSAYTVQHITSIGEDESFGLGIYISSNTTVVKKIVFSIPTDREPEELKLKYGLTSNEFAEVVTWFAVELELPS
jgi:hypothetical protein